MINDVMISLRAARPAVFSTSFNSLNNNGAYASSLYTVQVIISISIRVQLLLKIWQLNTNTWFTLGLRQVHFDNDQNGKNSI